MSLIQYESLSFLDDRLNLLRPSNLRQTGNKIYYEFQSDFSHVNMYKDFMISMVWPWSQQSQQIWPITFAADISILCLWSTHFQILQICQKSVWRKLLTSQKNIFKICGVKSCLKFLIEFFLIVGSNFRKQMNLLNVWKIVKWLIKVWMSICLFCFNWF